MNEIINWCNTNQGFLSAILTTMTIFMSAITIRLTSKVGKMPYAKKISADAWYYKEDGKDTIEVLIINTGLVTLNINHITVVDKKKTVLGSTHALAPIILKPSKYKNIKICIEDWNGMVAENAVDLNNRIMIKVHEYNGCVHTIKNGFGVG